MLYLSQFSTAPWYHVFFNKFFYSLLATDSLTQAGSSGTRFRAVLSRSMPREKFHNFGSRFWLVQKRSCNAFNAFFDQSGEKIKTMMLVFPLFSPLNFPALDAGVALLVRIVIGPCYLCFYWDWPSLDLVCVLVKRNSRKLNLLSDWHWLAKRSRKFSCKLRKEKNTFSRRSLCNQNVTKWRAIVFRWLKLGGQTVENLRWILAKRICDAVRTGLSELP